MFSFFVVEGDDATCFSNLANAEAGLGDWEQALKDYTYAVKLDPKFIAPQLGRNLVLFQLGKTDESLSYFKRLAEQYPVFADGQAALAVILFQKGDFVSAFDAWEVAIEEVCTIIYCS